MKLSLNHSSVQHILQTKACGEGAKLAVGSVGPRRPAHPTAQDTPCKQYVHQQDPGLSHQKDRAFWFWEQEGKGHSTVPTQWLSLGWAHSPGVSHSTPLVMWAEWQSCCRVRLRGGRRAAELIVPSLRCCLQGWGFSGHSQEAEWCQCSGL